MKSTINKNKFEFSNEKIFSVLVPSVVNIMVLVLMFYANVENKFIFEILLIIIFISSFFGVIVNSLKYSFFINSLLTVIFLSISWLNFSNKLLKSLSFTEIEVLNEECL